MNWATTRVAPTFQCRSIVLGHVGRPSWSPGKNSSFNLYYLDIAKPLQRFLQFLMQRVRVMHCIILWSQERLPFTIRNKYFIMIATRLIPDAVVDIHDAYPIIRDRLFVRTAELQRDPDLVLFAVYFLFNCMQLLNIVAQNTWLVASHLHLTAHNDHCILSPQSCRFFIGPWEDGYTDRASHIL